METTVTPGQTATTPSLPVTIITGFLGSGKTTLLNYILSNQVGLKTAVLVNEFGEVGIDNQLIISSDDDMVELNNGCVCCTINNDLLAAVYKVLDRPEPVDYLVVETTGLADPLPVALTFLGTELRDVTRLDSIITVVDAENFSVDLFNSQVAHNQIAYGDIILLNKTDLVDGQRLEALEGRIREMKEGARILRTTRGQAPLSLLLSVGLFESDRYLESTADPHDHYGHHHDDHATCQDPSHDHSTHDHLTTDGFVSLSFTSDRPLDIRKFQYFLDHQLPPDVFRAKGILWFKESPQRHVFHLSGKRFSLEEGEWQGPPSNQLVLIGQNLDLEKLRSQLEGCLGTASGNRGKGFGR